MTKDLQNKSLAVTNIRRGKGARQEIIYARLIDAETGELLISATLEYITEALNARM